MNDRRLHRSVGTRSSTKVTIVVGGTQHWELNGLVRSVTWYPNTNPNPTWPHYSRDTPLDNYAPL